MFSFIENWRDQRIIKRSRISPRQWEKAIQRLPILHRLNAGEKNHLINLSILFLHYKSLEGAHGLEITESMALTIALQACLPILNLGIDWYEGWTSVIVYPTQYYSDRTEVDAAGVHHQSRNILSGESWHRGPVVLAWDQTEYAAIIDGDNLVVHEFAHKLDILNGDTNGFPPLHANMDVKKWTDVMSRAFAHFRMQLTHENRLPINGYAATSPAEFFAVLCEVFFERGDILQHFYPDVYTEFKTFFRQDPLQRTLNSKIEITGK